MSRQEPSGGWDHSHDEILGIAVGIAVGVKRGMGCFDVFFAWGEGGWVVVCTWGFYGGGWRVVERWFVVGGCVGGDVDVDVDVLLRGV